MPWREIAEAEEADIERYVRRIMREVSSSRRNVSAIVADIDFSGMTRREQRLIIRAINDELSRLDEALKESAEQFVDEVYDHGRALAILALGTAVTLAAAKRLLQQRGDNNVHKAWKADEKESLVDDLLAATANTRRQVKRAIRQAASSALRDGRSGRQNTRVISGDLTRTLRKQIGESADMSIIDSSGRRWKLNTYVEMAVRTKLAEAQVEGERNQALEEGALYGVVSRHPNPCPRCAPWEGRIVKLRSDAEGNFPTLEDARAGGLLHPNCKHLITPVSALELLPARIRRLNGLDD